MSRRDVYRRKGGPPGVGEVIIPSGMTTSPSIISSEWIFRENG